MTPLDPCTDTFYHVYVLRSRRDLQFYTGFTGDLNRRPAEHHHGSAAATRHQQSLDLVYYEAYLHLDDAMRRGRYLKTSMGKRDLRKRLFASLNVLVMRSGSNGDA